MRRVVDNYNEIKTDDLLELDVVDNVVKEKVGCSRGFYEWLKSNEGKTIKAVCIDGDDDYKTIATVGEDFWYFTVLEKDRGKERGRNVYDFDKDTYKNIFFA